MPYVVAEFQETPNPNAVKCILDRPIRERSLGPASFRGAESASGDPVAAALFAIPGVAGVLINGDWITVNKQPHAEWAAIRRAVSRALAGLP